MSLPTKAVAPAAEAVVEKAWILSKSTVLSFIADDALSKGAAIAFYTVTSIAPILLIVIAVAGLAFGNEAAQNGIVGQLTGLMGKESAQLLQSAIASAQSKSSGTLATLVGVVAVIVTASGVFGEMQSALADHFLCTISKMNVGFFVSERLSALEAIFCRRL